MTTHHRGSRYEEESEEDGEARRARTGKAPADTDGLTAQEKGMLVEKLARIQERRAELEELTAQKRRLQDTLAPQRDAIRQLMIGGNYPRITDDKQTGLSVELVSRHNQRKPTLAMAYDAVRIVLGASAVDDIKRELKARRRGERESEAALQFVKTAAARKRRRSAAITSTSGVRPDAPHRGPRPGRARGSA
ncbi:Hypothetical protein UVM_LOCUS263 [uncultured virus]|nr:Hypothetical protein UVM_LOCUS263 [uncultured virus]